MDVASAFRIQSVACQDLGSDLYARLLTAAADELDAKGPISDIVDEWPRDPVADALALRFMAGVHRLVLTGAAPSLAAHYPSSGGRPAWPACTRAFLDVVRHHGDTIRLGLGDPPQTNEVGRSAVLLGGLLEISRLTSRPLRLIEIGASAGLNLLVDRYRYDLGGATWGPETSPVRIRSRWLGHTPDLQTPIEIDDRIGCDPHPLSVIDEQHCRWLRSFVWPDQTERMARLNGALSIAASAPPRLDRARASEWLPTRLARPSDGYTTVVMHSVVMPYLSASQRHEVMTTMRNAGQEATPDNPLAWLRMEPGGRAYELRMALWPLAIDVLLAEVHAHGHWAKWEAGGATV